jgi:hypothetical protein
MREQSAHAAHAQASLSGFCAGQNAQTATCHFRFLTICQSNPSYEWGTGSAGCAMIDIKDEPEGEIEEAPTPEKLSLGVDDLKAETEDAPRPSKLSRGMPDFRNEIEDAERHEKRSRIEGFIVFTLLGTALGYYYWGTPQGAIIGMIGGAIVGGLSTLINVGLFVLLLGTIEVALIIGAVWVIYNLWQYGQWD